MTADAATSRQRRQTRIWGIVLVVLLALLIGLVSALFAGLQGEQSTPADEPIAGLRPLLTLYGPGVGDAPFFKGPMGAAFGKNGRIYVADTGNNRIVVFSRNGIYLRQFGGLGIGKPAPGGLLSWKPGRLNYPTDVATDEDGDVYVADFRNDQIQVFSPDGRFLRAFPDRNKVVGKGASGQDGTGIAVTSLTVKDGRVYATDKYQVAVFDTDGRFITQFGKPGSGPGDLDHPNGIAVGLSSMLVVSDSNHNRVVAFTPQGRSLWSVGTRLGDVITDPGGLLEVPRGLTYTRDGKLVVADALASRLVRLSGTGEEDGTFGQRGDAPGELNFPTDVDSEEQRLVVTEKGNNRVQVVVIEED
jgi:sugar lactone lactonase YvrE